MSKPFSIKYRIKSFKFAIKGIISLFKHEHNSRIHLICAIFAVALAVYLKISVLEWAMIVLSIGIVFTAELINSAIERAIDLHSQEPSEKAGQAKDMAAAGVLIAAISSLIIGCIIFIPKLLVKF